MNLQIDCSTTLAPATTSDKTAQPRLKVSGLSCRRGDECLFRDFTFSIWPSQMVWLRGPNGSGKTTLLRTIAGLTQQEEGRVEWGEQIPVSHAFAAWKVVYVGHLNAMKDDLTVCESLQFMAGLHGCDDTRAGSVEALRRMGMHHRRNAPVRTLSQGQRRRAALARLALEHEPSLWILDEPFDALDTAGIEAVNHLLHSHLERGGSVLLTSHLELNASGPLAIEISLGCGTTV